MSLAWLQLLPVDSVDVVDRLRWLGVLPSDGFERMWYSSSFSDLTPGSFVSPESIRRMLFLFSPVAQLKVKNIQISFKSI